MIHIYQIGFFTHSCDCVIKPHVQTRKYARIYIIIYVYSWRQKHNIFAFLNGVWAAATEGGRPIAPHSSLCTDRAKKKQTLHSVLHYVWWILFPYTQCTLKREILNYVISVCVCVYVLAKSILISTWHTIATGLVFIGDSCDLRYL